MGKISIAIIFGGRSGEHEVSLQSARNVIEAIDRSKYELTLVGISKDGSWGLYDETDYLIDRDDPSKVRLGKPREKITLLPEPAIKGLSIIKKNSSVVKNITVAFPVLHGTFGEDGTIQGLFEMAGIAYVGSGVLGSSLCMDKVVTKRVLRDSGMIVADFIELDNETFKDHRNSIKSVTDKFKFPVFVKPANLGSSVGISKAKDEKQLLVAMEEAFKFDTKILVEEFIKGREIEVAVLGNDRPEASIPGEIIPQMEFYSYEAKYISDKGALLEAPAKLEPSQVERFRKLAAEAYRLTCCRGMARVDFFLEEKTGRMIVNEINTIPGFTKISMYPKLWSLSGITYKELINRLIELALDETEKKANLRRSI